LAEGAPRRGFVAFVLVALGFVAFVFVAAVFGLSAAVLATRLAFTRFVLADVRCGLLAA
jgi:hypothetical protein